MRQIAGAGRDSSFEAPVVGAVDPMSIDLSPWTLAVGHGTIYVNDVERCSILAVY